MGFLKAESSDWQGAHPGRVPTRRCGDVSLPFGVQGLGLAGRGQGVESRLAGLEADGPGSSQRYLKMRKGLQTIDLADSFDNFVIYIVLLLLLVVVELVVCFTSTQLCAWRRGPQCWGRSGWSELVVSEQVVQLGGA